MRTLGRTLLTRTAGAHRDDSGQMAILFVLTLLVVFIFFALAFDAGLWYFDHRTAQNQSEAAALAAVQELPATDTGPATAAADDWLTKNGSGSDERSCLDYSDRNGDGLFDTVRVCVRRPSPGIFAALSGIESVNVSASATATVGPVGFATVMPWMPTAPDPDCNDIGMTCVVDLNGDGDTNDPGEETCPFEQCPFGFNPNRLYSFKCGQGCPDEYAPGNLGSTRACGTGTSDYRDCITGDATSSGFQVGDTVTVGNAPGSTGPNTCDALLTLVSRNGETTDNHCREATYPCDVASTPDPANGLDTDVVAALTAPGGKANDPTCQHRKVVVPIGGAFAGGGASDREVLGLGVFYIAGWDRKGPWGDATGDTTKACGTASGGSTWPCGMVWGYLLFGQNPDSRFLLDQISDRPNPFAPLLDALID
jgi:hypothetical protein